MEKKAITMLPVSNLMHHPKNPRQDIGDVTELAASIKEKGILQNLTVIIAGTEEMEYNGANRCGIEPFLEEPQKHKYFVIIGNRRLEGAKAAGLEEVPCTIEGPMSLADQVGIMMQENMQREDLTIPEEAFGFQMMLDLGDTVKSISEKTGFSETKIRHRVKIAELDKETLQKKLDDENMQLSLKDLIELEKVDDPEEKNKILKEAKTSNELAWRVKSYVTEKEKRENLEKAKGILENSGIPHLEALDTWYPSGYEVIERIDPKEIVRKDEEGEELWDDADGYGIYPYGNTFIIAKESEEEPEEKEDPVKTRKDELTRQLNSIASECIADMRKFAASVIRQEIKPEAEPDIRTLWDIAMDDECMSFGDMRDGMEEAGAFSELKDEAKDDDDYENLVRLFLKSYPITLQLTAGPFYECAYGNTDIVRSWGERGRNTTMIEKAERMYRILQLYGYGYKDPETRDVISGRGALWDEYDSLMEEKG